MKITHVVVDGSNIATEGRDAPSLAQLDEAVQAFVEEYSPKHVTVVVDATFPNRIDRKERKTYEDAVNANELITPPAGAIGRGDAFILQIARRAGAAILSNDSFQEFHGDYPWLFEKGRLIGGKPVPHVGWVFMDRAPVRGPTSRRAVSEARKVAKAVDGAAEPVAAEVAETADAAPPPRRRRSRAKAAAAPPPSEAPTGTTGDGEGSEPAALATVAEEIAAEGVDRGRGGRSPEPYNEALPFIEFVAAHPVGSEVDATIERFSSHGAYVLVGSARAYVPLRNLADPAPRSAKEVLRVGDDQQFVVVAVDTPRRGIDLALPGVVDVPAPDLAGTADLVAELTVDVTDASAAQVAGEAEAGGRRAEPGRRRRRRRRRRRPRRRRRRRRPPRRQRRRRRPPPRHRQRRRQRRRLRRRRRPPRRPPPRRPVPGRRRGPPGTPRPRLRRSPPPAMSSRSPGATPPRSRPTATPRPPGLAGPRGRRRPSRPRRTRPRRRRSQPRRPRPRRPRPRSPPAPGGRRRRRRPAPTSCP